jgi:hypothetical protein
MQETATLQCRRTALRLESGELWPSRPVAGRMLGAYVSPLKSAEVHVAMQASP